MAVKSGGGAVVEHLGEWGCEVLEIVGRGGGRGRLGQHPVAGVAVARRLPAHGAARRGAQRVGGGVCGAVAQQVARRIVARSHHAAIDGRAGAVARQVVGVPIRCPWRLGGACEAQQAS